MSFHFEYSKLVGLLAILGTVLGFTFGATLYTWNLLVAILCVLIGIGSLALFIAFLYNYIKYAVYDMPAEHFMDDEPKE